MVYGQIFVLAYESDVLYLAVFNGLGQGGLAPQSVLVHGIDLYILVL